MTPADLAAYAAVIAGGVCVVVGVIRADGSVIAAGAGLLGGPAVAKGAGK